MAHQSGPQFADSALSGAAPLKPRPEVATRRAGRADSALSGAAPLKRLPILSPSVHQPQPTPPSRGRPH